MKNQSLNSILKFIEKFCDTSPFIRQFKAGDIRHYDTEDMDFPSMYVAPTISSINQLNKGVISNTIALQVMILDRVNYTDNGDNEMEIISDSIQILEDLIFSISKNQSEFSLEITTTYQPVMQSEESTNSREVGIIATISLKKPYISCVTPNGIDWDGE